MSASGRAGHPSSARPAARGRAFARAALTGNPSDGYGGATLAITLPARGASCEAFTDRAAPGTIDPPSPLVQATWLRFVRELVPHAQYTTSVRWHTSIPREVGLGGSSAIVIATLRALCELHQVRLGQAELARLAWTVEVEDLGIAAGLQDRVAQAYEGLIFMDFAPRGGAFGGHGRYEPLDLRLVPPLVVAFRSDAGTHSGSVHDDLRARFDRGEAAVLSAMTELAELARTSRAALLAGDASTFARCVDGSFDARRRMMALDERYVEMIECARAAGASANFTGSGGAVVAVCRDARQRLAVTRALVAIGCATLG